MAQLFDTAGGKIYIALTDEEKRRVYHRGTLVAADVANGNIPAGWNKYDINALTITEKCKPFEDGGSFEDIQVGQLAKYELALQKLYGVKFVEFFDLDIDPDYRLTTEEVRERMIHRRNLERSVKHDIILGKKINKSVVSSLFL